jgi:hypothetical protein
MQVMASLEDILAARFINGKRVYMWDEECDVIPTF